LDLNRTKESLEEALVSLGASTPTIIIEVVDVIQRTVAGKAPLIKAYHPT
jgi:hypothetical protein